jgi:hypothetical protein
MNVINKRTAVIVGLAIVGTGLLRAYAKKPENKDSFVTKIADTIGLTA